MTIALCSREVRLHTNAARFRPFLKRFLYANDTAFVGGFVIEARWADDGSSVDLPVNWLGRVNVLTFWIVEYHDDEVNIILEGVDDKVVADVWQRFNDALLETPFFSASVPGSRLPVQLTDKELHSARLDALAVGKCQHPKRDLELLEQKEKGHTYPQLKQAVAKAYKTLNEEGNKLGAEQWRIGLPAIKRAVQRARSILTKEGLYPKPRNGG